MTSKKPTQSKKRTTRKVKKDQMLEALRLLYGEEAANVRKQLSLCLYPQEEQEFRTLASGWYRGLNFYMCYADSILYDAKKSPLQNFTLHLHKIKELGCNAVYLLPFLDSPKKDQGFDVRDFYTIRSDLGTLREMKSLVKKARELQIHLFMDLVVNHVSEEHDWFVKAQQGNARYRERFFHSEEKPHFIRQFHQEEAILAEYEVEGKKVTAHLMMPEYAGPVPHWRQGKDGHWYYHSFYPEQIDVNWLNPEVLLEFAKMVVYWTRIGFNFRLDAVSFAGKGPYKKINEKSKKTYALIAILKWLACQINPDTVFLSESPEQTEIAVCYLGNRQRPLAELAYSFHSSNELWLAITTAQTHSFWKEVDQFKKLPPHAEWLCYLRSHDSLDLGFISDHKVALVKKAVGQHGEAFGARGIAGRAYSLLAEDEPRFIMAYFLLASLPGGIMIPYGDEIAKKNIPRQALPKAQQADPRNISRGVLQEKEYKTDHANHVFTLMKHMLSQRKLMTPYLTKWPKRIRAKEGLFAAEYRHENKALCIYINLTDETKKVLVKNSILITSVNYIIHADELITLGPYAGVWITKA